MGSFGDVSVLSQTVAGHTTQLSNITNSSIVCFGDSFTRTVSDVNAPTTDTRE